MHHGLIVIFALLLFGSAFGYAAEPTGLELFVGGGIAGSGPNLYVSLTTEGELKIRRTSLPIIPPGKLTETETTIKLKPEEVENLMSLAEATKDFAVGCKAVPDGTSAHLKLVTVAGQIERKCTSAARWPTGSQTKTFVRRLNSKIPEKFQIF